MLPVLLIGVGKLKEKWEREACAEYVKRLGRFCALEICELSDQPEPDKPSEALCIKGNSYDSEQFAAKLAGWSMDGRRLVLVIGGSLGLSDEVIARADEKLSFSKMTFPHQLMRVILLEQLYRGFKIGANERYHK